MKRDVVMCRDYATSKRRNASQSPEGSKVAMVKLVEHLRHQQYILFDAQLQNPHLERFGSYIVSSAKYKSLLHKAMMQNCFFV